MGGSYSFSAVVVPDVCALAGGQHAHIVRGVRTATAAVDTGVLLRAGRVGAAHKVCCNWLR